MNDLAAMDLGAVSRTLKALGDETRLRMVALLSHGELCVCHLEAALELPQPTISRQLGVLRNAGLVESRRDGAWIHYRLAAQSDALCRGVLRTLSTDFRKREVLARDVARLLRTRGPGACG